MLDFIVILSAEGVKAPLSHIIVLDVRVDVQYRIGKVLDPEGFGLRIYVRADFSEVIFYGGFGVDQNQGLLSELSRL